MIIPTGEEIRLFISESNAIENIYASINEPLFRNHEDAVMAAIRIAKTGVMPDLREIHKILLASEPCKNPGNYRSQSVIIGRRIRTPAYHLIPSLIQALSDKIGKGPESEISLDEWIWKVHYELECIHPFIDGNGRVGRIWMNSLRLIHGLPWLIILSKDRYEYYRQIDIYRRQHYPENISGDPAEDIETNM